MAAVTDVTLSIDRASFPGGSLCTIQYSYVLSCDDAEIEDQAAFTVWCELWGKDMIVNDALGDPAYDSHTVPAAPRCSAARSFTVPCSVLDEDLGSDEIFVKVVAISTLGSTASASSAVISDRF